MNYSGNGSYSGYARDQLAGISKQGEGLPN